MSSTAGMSFWLARWRADEITPSDLDSDVDSSERLDDSVECRVWRLVSSADKVDTVDCSAAFCDCSAGRALVDWAI